jgi:hypothetical protein
MTETNGKSERPTQIYRPVPCSAAERVRKLRDRRKNGFRCFTLELHTKDLDGLVRGGFLSGAERGDPEAVKASIYSFLDSVFPYPPTGHVP